MTSLDGRGGRDGISAGGELKPDLWMCWQRLANIDRRMRVPELKGGIGASAHNIRKTVRIRFFVLGPSNVVE